MKKGIILLLTLVLGSVTVLQVDAQSGKVRTENEKDVKKKDVQKIEDETVQGETIKIETSLVTVPITVRDKKTGGIYQGLKASNFAVYEDGVKQEIVNFAATEAPFTLVLLLEFSRQITLFRNEIINPAGLFVTRFVRPKDQVAIVAYDIKPAVLNDFTDDPAVLSGSIGILIRNLPAWSESNLFDALKFVIQGGKLDGVEYGGIQELQGNAAILLISSGLDTFSKINYSQALKLVENAGIPIYSIGIGNLFFKIYEDRMAPEQRLTWLQAANQLRSFSQLSGGAYFPVTFQGELPTTLEAITMLLRSQYTLAYSPTNTRRQGKKRKIEVHVDIDGDGQPDNKRLILTYRQSYQER
ncbi:MAG: VWA domain-containing protein [Acidobacteriota bacterium]|nr:VWA domain-containing protein [Blastocatellia bacterium]MDW8412496.1 VWA domain-containing protein [Acidobacteriota bacterium]